METKIDTATPSSPLVEDVRVAMRKAFHFGQTYWQQSDSDSVALNSESDETSRKFKQLVTDTCTALAAGIAQPAAQVAVLDDAAIYAEITRLDPNWQGKFATPGESVGTAIQACRNLLATTPEQSTVKPAEKK